MTDANRLVFCDAESSSPYGVCRGSDDDDDDDDGDDDDAGISDGKYMVLSLPPIARVRTGLNGLVAARDSHCYGKGWVAVRPSTKTTHGSMNKNTSGMGQVHVYVIQIICDIQSSLLLYTPEYVYIKKRNKL